MFKKLHILPEMTRNEEEDGYCYPEEYIGNIYDYKDQFIFFKKSSYETLSKGFLEIIIDSKIKTQLEILFENNKNIENLNTRLDEVFEEMVNKTSSDDIIEIQTHLEKNIINLKEEFGNQITNIKKESEESISSELEIVHNNMQEAVEKLIDKREPAKLTGKINLGTLFALKEAGYSPKEIGELKKEELI